MLWINLIIVRLFDDMSSILGVVFEAKLRNSLRKFELGF